MTLPDPSSSYPTAAGAPGADAADASVARVTSVAHVTDVGAIGGGIDDQAQARAGDTLARLAAVIDTRRGGDPATSYVARLFSKGPDAILKKIGEEATEVVMACKDGVPDKIVAEMADLWFHCLLALAAHRLAPADVLAELERRAGLSGLEEFAARKAQRREDDGS